MVTQYHFRLISQPINPGVICTPVYYTIRGIHNTYQDALWIHDFYLEFDKNWYILRQIVVIHVSNHPKEQKVETDDYNRKAIAKYKFTRFYGNQS